MGATRRHRRSIERRRINAARRAYRAQEKQEAIDQVVLADMLASADENWTIEDQDADSYPGALVEDDDARAAFRRIVSQ